MREGKTNAADRSLEAVQSMLSALGCDFYELGILTPKGMTLRSHLVRAAVISLLPYCKRNNANDAHIYIRAQGEHNLTLIDDLNRESIAKLTTDGFTPAAVVETSPGNFQAWLKHETKLTARLSSLAAKTLAERYGADLGSADWRHFGRLPGFTNRKRKHLKANGQYPFVLLHATRSEPFPMANHFHFEIVAQYRLLELQREEAQRKQGTPLSSSDRARLSRSRSLIYYRGLSKYHKQPAQADMAYAVFQLAIGTPPEAVGQELSAHYLSSDPDSKRRQAYIERTLNKAQSYVYR